MSYTPMQSDITLLFQKVKKRKIKIELLDNNFDVMEMLEGVCISDSITIDSSATNRRIYNCDIFVKNSSFLVGANKNIWFDKYIRSYVGIYDLRKREYVWYQKGTFAFDAPSYSFDESSNTLSLSCLDLMSMLSGDRNGRQTGLSFKIPAGEDIRDSIIGIIKVFGFTKYRIELSNVKVQYDLEFSANTTAYDMISELMQFCPNYEFFFDIDGTFVVQRMPCYTNDITILDNEMLQALKLSDTEVYSLDFKTVKNCIEVWGHEFEEDDLAGFGEATYSNKIYKVTFEAIKELSENMLVGIKIPTANSTSDHIMINDKWTFDLIDRYGNNLSPETIKPEQSYIFLYQNSKLYFLGQFQIHAIFKNNLLDSRFSISNVGEEIWEIKSDGEYSNILSDAEAMERAIYECYQSNFNESLSFSLEDIPWLDVNQKVSFKPQNMVEDNPVDWLITSINGSSTQDGGTLNLSLIRWYPDWSEVYDKLVKGR